MPDPLDESIFGTAAEQEARRHRESLEPPRRRRRGPIVLVIVLAVLVAGAVFAFTVFRPLYDRVASSKDYDGDGTGSVSVVVKEGDSGATIAQTLQRAGVVKTTQAFTDALATTKGDEIQPGTYTLKKEMKAAAALSMLREGNRDVWKVTVREGLWKTEVYDTLAKATGLPRADYDAVDKQAAANPAVLGLPATTKGNPEGWLFPATYTFDKNTKPVDQLKAMVTKTQGELTELGVTADKAEQTLTFASIIEAEARRDEDRPKVARVILNRMDKGMNLQLDSTVSYGVQRRAITTTDEERASTNLYNTYLHPGLPVGPIDNPGAASVKAALNPADGTWLFFVAVNPDTGETKFATSDADHAANVAEFQRWCAANPGKC